MKKQQRIERVEAEIGFRAHALNIRQLTPELKIQLKDRPKDGEACAIKGALPGMWEPGILCGYMMTSKGLKALVIFDEREAEDGPVFDFVFATRVTKPRQPKPERDILSRRPR